jgi:hypothetical protein
MKKLRVLAAVALFTAVGPSAIIVSAAPPTIDVVMSGLDNPRGLGFGPEGALYVAEAGKGGPPGPDNCMFVRGQTQCAGASGAVSRLWKGKQERIAHGMPSYAPQPSGAGATGPHDVSLQGRIGWITIGLGGNPSARPVWPGEDFGRLVRMLPNGNWSFSTDVSDHEAAHNPDGNVPDSNPYGILARSGRKVMTDAGGNDLLEVAADGTISTLPVFPARPGRATDSVPTAVALGSDGAYYVSELTGVPFAVGAANIYRVEPGEAPQVFLSGFTAVIDLAFGCDRSSLYVLQHATGPGLSGPGALIRVATDGSRTTVASAELTSPTSVAIACGKNKDAQRFASDDDEGEDEGEVIYVSNRGTSAGVGEVLRIQP